MDLTHLFFSRGRREKFIKLHMIMKLLGVFILGSCLQLSASGIAQTVNISAKNVPLQKIFKQIHRQTGFQFFYEDALLDKAGNVTVDVQGVSIEEAMEASLKNQPLKFDIVNKTIVISAKPAKTVVLPDSKPIPPPVAIRGTIRSDKGEPLQGISVMYVVKTKCTFC